jgi:tripartite-type tricarboxylate transporter receptor subunit TctC
MAIVIGRREPWSGYMKKFFSFALALLTTSIVSALAQSYPTRTITIVIAFPPGGPNEGVVRFLAEKLTPSLGQAVIIENRPGGAGGTVGTRSVANAAPDGHTLLLSPPGPLVVAPLIYKNVGYDPAKAFTPITAVFSIPQMLVVNPAVPVKSVQELIAYAKTNPGKISFPSPGYGTQPHLLGEMFKLMAGIDIIHIPYKGPAAAITDLLAGQVQMYFENIGLLLPHIEAGKLRALAVADEARSLQLPNVPTTVESGWPKLKATYWSAMLAPAGTPTSTVNRLNTEINAIMRTKEMDAILAKLSAKPEVGSPKDLSTFIAAETQKWAAVVNAANIKVD